MSNCSKESKKPLENCNILFGNVFLDKAVLEWKTISLCTKQQSCILLNWMFPIKHIIALTWLLCNSNNHEWSIMLRLGMAFRVETDQKIIKLGAKYTLNLLVVQLQLPHAKRFGFLQIWSNLSILSIFVHFSQIWSH